MTDKLDAIRLRFHEVNQYILEPDIMADMKRYSKLMKEYKELQKIDDEYKIYENILANLKSSKEILDTEKDQEFRDMAKQELEALYPLQAAQEAVLKNLLIPNDPNDSKNIILEIRAGAGGDEASIFAGDLFRMYQRFAEKRGWKMELIDYMDGTSGGFKEIVASMAGEDVYGVMKYESGVHRVQRVPATETQGRIHTSAASVAVLPEMEDLEVVINPNDVRIDTFCSSGPGGQSVNTTYSAVRLTHIPTGLVVSCQDEKSQMKNKEKAFKVLRSRVYELEFQKQQAEVGAQRNAMIGGGDRSDKIRTYNYPQSRVTDHRIGFTMHNLPAVMDGSIDGFVEELRLADNAEKLRDGTTS